MSWEYAVSPSGGDERADLQCLIVSAHTGQLLTAGNNDHFVFSRRHVQHQRFPFCTPASGTLVTTRLRDTEVEVTRPVK